MQLFIETGCSTIAQKCDAVHKYEMYYLQELKEKELLLWIFGFVLIGAIVFDRVQ